MVPPYPELSTYEALLEETTAKQPPDLHSQSEGISPPGSIDVKSWQSSAVLQTTVNTEVTSGRFSTQPDENSLRQSQGSTLKSDPSSVPQSTHDMSQQSTVTPGTTVYKTPSTANSPQGTRDRKEPGPHLIRQNQTWWDAAWYCQRQQRFLASITSEVAQARILALLRGNATGHGVWIGLSHHQLWGHWVWVSGEAFDYASWRDGEPNNLVSENCVMVQEEPKCQWDAHFWASICNG
ncbi:C-type mannose receptor 2 [Microcaecilia unicolor]|uniref:C-type mannose receptor 2-like n=1 Tax=Microcaecilia unicolor TaxID=1415580 RepID=A0A6P7XS03_9AMPH|nr:C-type mannose receptor 2-like [Microcaecilia unicolor]XP_030053220.1 C-type mannose receptor 2-like [Microcaecilia unicolor]